MMTPFASLDRRVMEKNAYIAPVYAPPQEAAPDAGGGWGEVALDVAAGSNPVTGVPYFGYKALKDFSNGNWGSGLMNIGAGALSFLPGASIAKGAIKGGGKLATMFPRITQGMSAARSAVAPAVQPIMRPINQALAPLRPTLTPGVHSGLGTYGGTAAGTGFVGSMFEGPATASAAEPQPAPPNYPGWMAQSSAANGYNPYDPYGR